ncbi:ATP-binding protein [Lactobacillaceae bacterium 24-114]
MALEKANFYIPKSVFKDHINLDDPSLIDKYKERNQNMEAMYNRQAIKNRINLYKDKSLWEGAPLEFSISDWEPNKRKDEKQARDLGNKAVTLARQMLKKRFNVLMVGDAGVGKTSLAMMMASILQQHDKTVMFVSANELKELCADQYNYPESRAKLKDRQRFMNYADVLIIDDLGAEAGNVEQDGKSLRVRRDFQALIYRISQNRFEGTKEDQKKAKKEGRKLPHPVRSTIVTTNNIQDELEKIYGSRTVSRLITLNPEHRLAFNDMEDMRQQSNL